MSNTNPAIVIPFAQGNESNATSSTQLSSPNPPQVLLCAFGYSKLDGLGSGFDPETGTPTQFISTNALGQSFAFATQTDITRVTIHGEVYVSTDISSSYSPAPYVALAVANPGSNTFKVLQETKLTIANQTNYSQYNVYANKLENVEVFIPKGSRLVVVCGHDSTLTGTSGTTSYPTSYFYFSGGIALW